MELPGGLQANRLARATFLAKLLLRCNLGRLPRGHRERLKNSSKVGRVTSLKKKPEPTRSGSLGRGSCGMDRAHSRAGAGPHLRQGDFRLGGRAAARG